MNLGAFYRQVMETAVYWMCNGAQELSALEFSYGSTALQFCSLDPSAGAEL